MSDESASQDNDIGALPRSARGAIGEGHGCWAHGDWPAATGEESDAAAGETEVSETQDQHAEARMIPWALISVAMLASVTFAAGFVCGKNFGRRQAHRQSLDASSLRASASRAVGGPRRPAFPAGGHR
jgi:hypothetical protein